MNIPNFPTDNSGYEYTDEDFIRDTQPCWQVYETKPIADSIANKRAEILRQLAALDALEQQEKTIIPNDDVSVETDDEDAGNEQDFELDYNDKLSNYDDDLFGPREDYAPYDNDYLLSVDKEDNTPDGWPDTFYEY